MNFHNVLEVFVILILWSIFTVFLLFFIWKLRNITQIKKVKKSFVIKNIGDKLSKRIHVGYLIIKYGDNNIRNLNKYCYIKYDKTKKELKVDYTLLVHKKLGTYFHFFIDCKNTEDLEQIKMVLTQKNQIFRNVTTSLSILKNKRLYFMLDEFINDEIEKRRGIKYNYVYPQ